MPFNKPDPTEVKNTLEKAFLIRNLLTVTGDNYDIFVVYQDNTRRSPEEWRKFITDRRHQIQAALDKCHPGKYRLKREAKAQIEGVPPKYRTTFGVALNRRREP